MDQDTHAAAAACRLAAVARTVGSSLALDETLDAVARAVVESLGFHAAVVNILAPDGDLHVVAVAGSDEVRAALQGTRAPLSSWQEMLAAAAPWGELRFLSHEVGLPDGAADMHFYVPPAISAAAGDEVRWHPQDALFAPLVDKDGQLLGVLSVDDPTDGTLPGPGQRAMLEAFAVQASIAIDHARTHELDREQRADAPADLRRLAGRQGDVRPQQPLRAGQPCVLRVPRARRGRAARAADDRLRPSGRAGPHNAALPADPGRRGTRRPAGEALPALRRHRALGPAQPDADRRGRDRTRARRGGGHHRGARGRRAAAAPRPARLPDRAAQPDAHLRPDRPGARALPPRRRVRRGDGRRHRPLQARQRQPRPSCGGPPARPGSGGAPGRAAWGRHRRAARRRRVRRRLRGPAIRRRRGRDGRAPASRGPGPGRHRGPHAPAVGVPRVHGERRALHG